MFSSVPCLYASGTPILSSCIWTTSDDSTHCPLRGIVTLPRAPVVLDGISERTVWRAEAPHEGVFFGVGAQCIDFVHSDAFIKYLLCAGSCPWC